MHITRRDALATTFVGVGVAVAGLWAIGVGPHSDAAVRTVTAVVLALGFAASASAVVPGFTELLHGSKIYVVATSLIGLGAFAAGIAALVTGRELMLGLLVAATLVLWAVSTARHSLAAGRAVAPALGGPAPAR